LQEKEIAKLAKATAIDAKAQNVVLLDMQGVTPVMDYSLICSGTSRIHVQNIADQIRKTLKVSAKGYMREEGYNEGRWILLDAGSLVAHVFQEEDRLYYDLERLWRDAKKVTD
jgi:ribosome-associated protein